MSLAQYSLLTNYCFVIPSYNHSETLPTVLKNIEPYQLECILIDDGSSTDAALKLEQISALYPWVTLLHLATNQGKGAAVMAGLEYALNHGFTHAIQIDADGQHDSQSVKQLLEQSQLNPDALISGYPVYDNSVPKHRLIARYITHFWVWVETLSFSIKDSMCGFRIYPLQQTLDLIKQIKIGKRMDFDTDIMVRLYWQGTPSIFVPTHVTYPKDGISHFNAFKDNVRISWMHTRLFFGMIPRLPLLLRRKQYKNKEQRHWSQTPERKGLFGIRFILKLYQLFGRNFAKLIMYPVITYFWLTGNMQRQASKSYLEKIKNFYDQIPYVEKKQLTTFHHFQRFGESLLDKIASWNGDIKLDQLYFPNNKECLDIISNKRGIILICSHLGDIEMCRALAELSHNIKINALVFKKHAMRFQQVLQEVNQASAINLIQVDTLGPSTAILLKEKLDNGEWVAIVGDRTSSNPHQRMPDNSISWANFLGDLAPFPKGPFILSSALGYPVYLIWGLKPNGRFQIYFEHFSDGILLPRQNRQNELNRIIQDYAKRLEHYCLISPLDWFNFYDFWRFTPPTPNKLNKDTDKNEK
ncbi:glycosyltransferase family 2 protein [Gilliamella sp. ESL0250]|uniref:glycosyltransferase family 2 protein n=1 Tax=Gilliamella sp. ESL0250 TaxID=2705036 RepID=UPI0015801585|nr:glycosyltransferase family 2 protein [Gilliamella sp. ESL0250]NUF48709.1 glycosyltransferase family 2 protein [Gilliamella sp. ESL0250]